MADVTSLVAQVEAYGDAVMTVALSNLEARLDIAVPDSGQVHPYKLRQGRLVLRHQTGGVFYAEVVYTAPTADDSEDVANLTEFGTTEHSISGGKGLKGGKPLTFFWPKVGHVVHFWEVQWKPGPGVARNIGWFSRTMRQWAEDVAAAASEVA